MAGVNVKMGVSGVAQFKKGIKDSQSAVKSLEAALKLNETAMKDNANQEQYLQNKTELLTKQLEAQKSVVSQTEQALRQMEANGVNKTSAAFQNLQAQLYKAQTDFITIQNELEGVGESGEAAEEGVSTMNAQLRKIGEGVSWQNVAEGIGKITDGLQKAATAAFNMGKRIVEATLSGGQWADELQTSADQWEIDPETLYRMRQASNRIDTDTDVILAAQQRLRKGLGKGSTDVMGAFAALIGEGYNPQAAGWENAFWDAGEALMNFGDAEEREAYANTLFGKSWNELIPLFKEGRQAYEDAMDSYTWIGDKQFESLKKVDDASQDLNSEWEALKKQFEATMADVMTPVMETLTALMKEFNEYLQTDEGQEMLKKLGDAVSSLFSSLSEIDPDKVMEGVVSLFTKITEGLQWIIDNKETVKTALEVIALAFAGIKVAGLAANIARIVSGIGQLNLFGGRPGTAEQVSNQAAQPVGIPAGKGGGIINGITLLAGADAMWRSTEGQIVQRMKEFRELTAGMTQEDASAAAWAQTLGMTEGQYRNWKEQQNVPEGTGHGAYFGEIPEEFNQSVDRMTEVAGETDATLKNTNRTNEQLTGAVNGLNALPAEMQTAVTTAVENGMKNVIIVLDENCVEAIGRRISGGMGGQVLAMVR